MKPHQHILRAYRQPRLRPGFVLALLTGLFLWACLDDVPRDNPLDPALGNHNFLLNGTVQTYYAPRSPIADALVWLEPGTHITRTAADGSFRIENIAAGRYTVYCSAEGYASDSVQVNITANKQLNFNLNGLPRFVSRAVTTHHIARWFPLNDVYYLETTAQVTDADGLADIKQVICEIPYSAFRDTLDPELNAGHFKKTFFTQDLNINSLHELLGQPVYFIAEDNPGAQLRTEGVYAARILEKTAALTSPVELQAVPADSIHFRWEWNPPAFDHTLKIDVYAINAGIVTSVKTIDDIPAGYTDWLYRSDLPAGDYFWTVTIRDAFGNTSQSKEQVFQIQ